MGSVCKEKNTITLYTFFRKIETECCATYHSPQKLQREDTTVFKGQFKDRLMFISINSMVTSDGDQVPQFNIPHDFRRNAVELLVNLYQTTGPCAIPPHAEPRHGYIEHFYHHISQKVWPSYSQNWLSCVLCAKERFQMNWGQGYRRKIPT